MFQYAFYLRLKSMHPFEMFLFDIGCAQMHHNGYELDRIFQIRDRRQSRNYRWIRKHCPKLLKAFHAVKQKDSLEYDPRIFETRGLFMRYEGFWQSEKYFLDIEERIRLSFQFNERLLNVPTKALCASLANGEYVSVHVRRGDYVAQKENFGLCDEEYYQRAIGFIERKVVRPIYVFFSDEIGWAKERFHNENVIFVDWNHANESWQDMFLMTRCKHNIIANSSFSWWGAWLNPNKEKIVVAPKRWFEFIPNYDILPEGWVAV